MTQQKDIRSVTRMKKTPRWLQSRGITKRLVVTGTLTLLTPARFGGGGQGSTLVDMPILLDPATNRPLLMGSSIAGAMRAYLRDWVLGYEEKESKQGDSLSQRLFGDVVENESRESYLIVEDTRAETLNTEFRPGVSIDPKTRIAKEADKGGMLFDMELLTAGTQFPLRIELALPEDEAEQTELKQALAVALTGFERGEIGLGARKRRGFGECKVTDWRVETYDLKNPSNLISWLKDNAGSIETGKEIAALLGVALPPDHREYFRMRAHFQLATSLLIRSGGGSADAPDMVHLQSKRNGKDKPILSGTSLAGAVRARALRIANTVRSGDAKKLVDAIFGGDVEAQSKRGEVKASKAIFYEREVKGRDNLVQTRIKIDRFTGGTYPGALFDQQPVFGGEKSQVEIDVELRKPEDAHIGLLLHVLKDLWTSDLPLGGEASVGRGRLKGIRADLSLQKNGNIETWTITERGDGQLQIEGDRDKLERFARAVAGGAG